MILAALLAVATGTTVSVAREREPGTHIAFVGELISFKQLDPCAEAPPPGELTTGPVSPEVRKELERLRCLGMDELFEARYRVEAPVAGMPPATEVTFRMGSHRGRPPFLQQRHALLVVTLDEGGAWLQKYQGYSVYRLARGGWATCGQDASAARRAPSARPLPFVEPIRDLRGEDAAQVAKWRVDPGLRISGEQLFCARGVPVGEYLDYLRNGVLEARGVVLEPAPAKP